MTQRTNTVIFWGAGATAALGVRTTAQQTEFLGALADARENRRPLDRRVACALGKNKARWAPALRDLLTILGDAQKGDASPFTIVPGEMDAMRRNWRTAADDEIRSRIADLRVLYDWPALKAVIAVCPGPRPGEFKITDLFNLLDMHGQSRHGFRVPEGGFLTPQRVSSAHGALKMLLHTMFYIDWQHGRVAKRRVLDRHYEFAVALGRRMQRRGIELAKPPYDRREFYMGDVGFASMNYDPVALWLQFVAHRDLNTSPAVPHIGSPAARLRIFHDLGHFVAGPRVKTSGRRDPETPYHPMNETSAQRLNDADHASRDRIRIVKFLFPHGCLWWRECPDCGKLSSYMGDSWDRDSPILLPPPPLKAFAPDGMFRPRNDREKDAWDTGKVDARACVHCETLTYAHHTQTAMQSNFKSPPPPFMEEMRRDLRVAVQNAGHIVLMGYSLPPDDVEYRAFFAARHRRNRADGAEDRVRCSVVVGTGFGRRWLRSNEWRDMLSDTNAGEAPRATLEAARDLFGEKNVRFYGGGIPDVFLDGGDRVTDSAVDDLLNWENA